MVSGGVTRPGGSPPRAGGVTRPVGGQAWRDVGPARHDPVMTDDDKVVQRYDRRGRRGHEVITTRPGPLAGVLAGLVGATLALSPELLLVPGGAYLTVPALRSPLLLVAIAAVVVGVLVARRHPGWATLLVLM